MLRFEKESFKNNAHEICNSSWSRIWIAQVVPLKQKTFDFLLFM